MVGHVPREISIFCRSFLNYGGLLRESKGFKVQEVANSERWTWNSNNDGDGKAHGFASGLQQDERARIGILHRARKYKKSKVQSDMDEWCANDDLEESDPANDVKASQQTDAKVHDLEDVICID